MRRSLVVATLALAGLAVSGDVLGAPPTSGQTISFENVPNGAVYYVYSDDGQGPFAIDAFTSIGRSSAVIQSTQQGKNHVLAAPAAVGCDCSRIELDLTACDAGYVNLLSFRLLGTSKPTKVVYEDAGGNSWPSVYGQMIAPTGASGSTIVTPPGAYGQVVSRVLVYFEDGGAVDDVRFVCPDDPCMPPPPPTADGDDWFTGGGFIFDTPSGVKANYGVGGGFKNGAFWGHLNYIDHATGMHFKGTSVTAYSVTGATSRHTEGTCKLNGVDGYTYKLDIADNGEPGVADKLRLEVFLGTTQVYFSDAFSGTRAVDGGNIQLHKANTATKGKAKSKKKKNHK
jgi:hypothetical protein